MRDLPGLFGGPGFLAFVLLFFFVSHLYRITDPPSGYHRWREADTAAVARNFATESWDFFQPRIDMRGAGDGVVGMELPVYGYAIAAVSTLGWDIHGWARLLTIVTACIALVGLHGVVRAFSGRRDLAGVATFLAASVPLFSYYGRKIQPDVWTLAFAVTGLWAFVRWTQGGPRILAFAAAACTAIAGAVKPPYLAVGLPMLVALWKADGARLFLRPRSWWFATASIAPVWLWVQYARGLDPESTYFYMGGDWHRALEALGQSRFYENVFRTWLLELAIGTPVLWAFVWGLGKLPTLRNAGFLVAWIVAVFATFFPLAGQMAAAHDYYSLGAVFPLAVVTALGVRAALSHSRRWVRALAIVTLLAMPVYGFGRMSARWGEPYEFWEGRLRATLHLPERSLVVSHDPVPPFLFYYTGTKGWWLPPGGDVATLERAAREGARYLLVENGLRDAVDRYRELLGAEVYSDYWLTAYEIVRPADAGSS